MTVIEHIHRDALALLYANVKGEVILPEDANYDEARRGWNLAVDQYPRVIVISEDVYDVAAAVRYAKSEGLNIAAYSRVHGSYNLANDAMMIITKNMIRIKVNPKAQTATIEAGAKWGMVLPLAQEHGLAPLLGSSPEVGVVGYTLGGGMGWLARKYGMATDSLIDVELVTANGYIIHANDDQNPDLFWALRGGGGNFGVVTEITIKLFPVSTVYGGNLFYHASMAKAVMEQYRQWVKNVPDEMTSSVVIMNFPPIPDLPEILRGQSYAIVRGLYAGDLVDGEALINQWREWQKPVIDAFKEMPFSQVATVSNDPVDPLPGYNTGAWLNEINDDVIKAVINYTLPHAAPPVVVFTEIRHAGGAITKADASLSAFGNRDAQFNMGVIAVAPTPEIHAVVANHALAMKHDMQSALTGGVYMNFMEGKEAQERTPDAFSHENFTRLQSVKAKYDPDNRFRYSFGLAAK